MVKPTNDEPTASSPRLDRFQQPLIFALVLQNTATVIVGRYTRTSNANSEELYDLNEFILVSECCKLLLSFFLEWWVSDFQLAKSWNAHMTNNPFEALKMAAPAAIYLVSNTLLYVALSNLTVPIYQVVYQSKLVITALISAVTLSRRYSLRQWLCLLFISFGVGIIATEGKMDVKGKKNGTNIFLGLSSLILSCLLSSFASVYFEKVLKKRERKKEPSIWMRNIQLSFFSIFFACVKCVASPNHQKSLLHGFDKLVWLQVVLFGIGGLLVASVILHADNVIKGMATATSIVLATILSVFLFDTNLSLRFFLGSIMVLPSVYFYSNPYKLFGDENRSAALIYCFTTRRLFRVLHIILIIMLFLDVFSRESHSMGPPVSKSFCRGSHTEKHFGMHSLRKDLLKNERPPGITDIEWVLSKQFSDIEDSYILAEWEKTRPEEERNILTFVMSVTDGYDVGPPDVSSAPLANHSKVKFVFLSDDMEYSVPSPWNHYKKDYPSWDHRVDFGYRNSLSRLKRYVNDTGNSRQYHYANMWTKYYCHLFWRIPEVRKSRYVAYVGGGVNLGKMPYDFYDRFVDEMSKGNHRLHIHHHTGEHRTLYEEAEAASGQKRYEIDDVITQAEWYATNFKISGNNSSEVKVFWMAFSAYDNYHAPTRQVLFDTWVECQLWSLEDQISYPVALALSGELWNTTAMVSVPMFSQSWLGLSSQEPFRFAHETHHYGS